MLETYALLIFALLIILAACELFSNGVEWFGHRLNLGEGAVGSILAAIGTALPETIIPIFAILFSAGAGGEHIGVGAIIGSSFMLATLAMFVVGTAIFIFTLRGRRDLNVDAHFTTMSRDIKYFLFSYGLALTAAAIPARPIKLLIAAALIGVYVNYVRVTLSDCGETGCDLRPLHFHREGLPPRWRFIAVQLVVALGVIIYGAHLFVEQVLAISNHFAISALVLSLLITPIATELPEKFNSVLWVRNRKDTLALGNITGAMVFQSTFLPMFGIVFTPWHLTEPAIVAASLGLVASTILLVGLENRQRLHAVHLAFSGVFYFGYIAYIFLLNRLGEGFLTAQIARLFHL